MKQLHQLSEHPVQVTTLALWLVVATAAVVGMVVKDGDREILITVGQTNGMLPDSMIVAEPFASTGDGQRDQAAVPIDLQWPPPPEMPVLAASEPLPEVPEVPDVNLTQQPTAGNPVAATGHELREKPAVLSGRHDGPASDLRDATRSSRRGGAAPGAAAMAARMAAGSMPAPRYPSEARRRGQSGTVVVEFTVGASGRVVSASLKEPSRWPLLNREALRAVQGWKFPAGDVMTMQRPIVFQLR